MAGLATVEYRTVSTIHGSKTIHVIEDWFAGSPPASPPAGPAQLRPGTHFNGKGKSVTWSLQLETPGNADSKQQPGHELGARSSLEFSAVSDVGLGWAPAPTCPLEKRDLRGSMAPCPCCAMPTLNGMDEKVARVEGACDNRRWGWKGEPTFCCMCASLKGLGRLSHFGCDSCKLKRAKFYKRRTFFDANCKHCGLAKRIHETTNSNGQAAKYPRCPMSRMPTPPQ